MTGSILLTLALCHIIFTSTIVLAGNESQRLTIAGKKVTDIQ